ncbi:GntR family transcriptional regulator, transcriptional repressor for pyruvate dehydrogenase complex [Peribacillus simplex]|uniref:GntR family transcriptional regulator, transcriptional repressor for pyruvate dehydrogenase complex n=1 Tax=Peribacillus simplex TaxID=1478 RepID=A0A9X8RAL9_9BACI|nr:FadR/GntR family transcriptional regulator [Peribacillus simplex]SIR60180.1 GntR family transcriptional regulator, transcriptional repressor for pyruvate dehydrogenase complex [Peribacillus simplex]
MTIVSETVQKFLCDFILKNSLMSGDQLPSERELAKLLEVSRSSVREALQSLSEKEIIEKKIGKGVYVKKSLHLHDSAFSSTFEISVNIDNSLDLLELRKVIEAEIAFLAAKRIKPSEIHILEQSLVDLEVCIKMGTSIIVPDLVFHRTLARSTNNQVIIDMYNNISEFFKKVRIEMATYDDTKNALHYHQQILKAVKKGDSDRSSKLMKEHIEDVKSHYIKMVEEYRSVQNTHT